MSTDESLFSTTEASGESVEDASAFSASPLLLVEWDARLHDLWNPSLNTALHAARELYTSDGLDAMLLSDIAEEIATKLWRTLSVRQARPPETAEERYQAVIKAVWAVLRAVRQTSVVTSQGQHLLVALRPIRKLHAGVLTPEVCATLYDFHSGIWEPHLDKAQRWRIRTALARTIAALPPNEMDAFWENLHSADPMLRGAMLLGLEFLRSAHAVPHLVRGLEQSEDHATRSAIVDCLEEIADPRAIAPLIRLRQATALSDWTLSRHIGRVLRVIEQQNRGQFHRTLLRPSQTPPGNNESLLRPAADPADIVQRRAETERAMLLRPAGRNEPTGEVPDGSEQASS
jgi:hypothetical protein